MAWSTRTADEVPQQQHNNDRLRRADTWLERSEKAAEATERYIFLWIAFNAAYGWEITESGNTRRTRERQTFERFLQEILNRDERRNLEKMLCYNMRSAVDSLLSNKYIYQPFWNATSGLSGSSVWHKRFEQENKRALRARDKKNVHTLLPIVFLRLYALRNQIFHGGATFGKGWGQEQVREGSHFMTALVPVILDIMRADIKRNPDSDVWGRVCYPRINYNPD